MSSIFQLSNITFLFEMLRTAFDGVEWFLIAYLVCLAGFFVVGREHLSVGFLYPFLFMLVTIFNPFLIVPLAERIGLITRFRRLFWLLPVNLVLAYAFTMLCSLRMRKQARVFLAVVCSVFIVTVGTSAAPYLQLPKNIYKTSNEVMTLSSILAEDAAATGLERRALYSSQYLLELRQFDPSIRCVLRRNDLLDWEIDPEDPAAVEAVIHSNHQLHRLALVSRYGLRIDREAFLQSARKCAVNYIITDEAMELADYYEAAGYEKIGQAGVFEVYRAGEALRSTFPRIHNNTA